ncbi:class I mannose-6-phosphate isomerase [Microlunatus spumicola]|uniref:Phosphohexomutase n=1 Tax=Microlunatus spumicola TaxID=81499 RepID=A0ABP6WS01_9ACTN
MSAPTSRPGGGPYVLAPNQPRRPYRGGAGIAALRGTLQIDDHRPEDFLASTTSAYGTADVGQSRLPDGTALRDAVEQDPEWFLGAEHVRRHGSSTQLLVKLINPGQRLFAHLHPDDDYARRRLDEPNGKTEAWVVVDAPAEGATAYLGFREEVGPADVARWVDHGDTGDLLGRMNEVELAVGDAFLVPAGLAHALAPGLTIVELQQPSDLSVLLEWRGFDGLTAESATLGLDAGEVFDALESTSRSAESLEALLVRRALSAEGGATSLLPAAADRFFRADLLDTAREITLEPSFAVLVVVEGVGDLTWDDGTLGVGRGDVVLVPHGLGDVRVSGDLRAVRCRPPRVEPAGG